ncbi:MAG: sigma-70 family RNA polymerase sigma factor [Planctomycetota bacterium]
MSIRRRATADKLFARYVSQSDLTALGQLFQLAEPELMGIAIHLTGSRSLAEDLVQSTFSAAIESRDRFAPSRPVMPWLVGIMAKLAHRVRRETPPQSDLVDTDGGEIDPSDVAASAELRDALTRARRKLRAPYREVIDLYFDDALSAGEIATRLGRHPSTVRTQLARGLEMLRGRLPEGFASGLAITPTGWLGSGAAARTAEPERRVGTWVAAGPGRLGRSFLSGWWVMASVAVAIVASLIGAWTWFEGRRAGEPVVSVQARNARLSRPASAEPSRHRLDPIATQRKRLSADTPGSGSGERREFVVQLRWRTTGLPAASQGVRLLPVDGPNPALRERRGVTDHNGRCVLGGVPLGRYRVISGLGTSKVAELGDGATRPVTLEVSRSGSVPFKVVDCDGRPMPEALIWLSAPGDVQVGFKVARTDRHGRCRVPLAGVHFVRALKAGYLASLLAQVAADSKGETVTLTLRGRAGEVRGQVCDVEGQPIARAKVTVVAKRSWAERAATSDAPRDSLEDWTETDALGIFYVTGVSLGDVQLQVDAPGYAPGVASAVVSEAEEVARVVVVLARGATVRGRVLDQFGRPIAGAVISSGRDAAPGHRTAISAEDGSYLLDALPVGSVTLWCAANEAARPAATITESLREDVAFQWSPTLSPAEEPAEFVRFSGVVRGPGQPLVGLRFAGVRPGEPPLWHSIASTNGAFTTEPWPAGVYRLCVLADGYGAQSLGLHRANCSEIQLGQIELRPPGDLDALVLDHLGDEVPDGPAHLVTDDGLGIRSGRVSGSRLRIEGLSPGRYVVRFAIASNVTASRPVRIYSGGTTRAVLRVARGVPCRIELLGATPRSTLAQVRIRARNQLVATAVAVPKGGVWVAVVSLPAGEYEVTCFAESQLEGQGRLRVTETLAAGESPVLRLAAATRR